VACGVVESGTVGCDTLAPELDEALDVELDGARETELEDALE
jgi:hypothetical protein